jgi:hypothetical protein
VFTTIADFERTWKSESESTLMRQAGLALSGVCGPSREEWAAFGMPAPAV